MLSNAPTQLAASCFDKHHSKRWCLLIVNGQLTHIDAVSLCFFSAFESTKLYYALQQAGTGESEGGQLLASAGAVMQCDGLTTANIAADYFKPKASQYAHATAYPKVQFNNPERIVMLVNHINHINQCWC